MVELLGLTVRAEYHWGYWVRVPFTTKLQSSLPVPPPTTLIGALAGGLVREGFLKSLDGNKISGEMFVVNKEDLRSPASLLDDALITASAAFPPRRYAFLMDDINRYVTLLFQAKIKEKIGEEEIPRRYLPQYRTGAIHCGKVYYPSGPIDLAYLFNLDKLKSVIEGDPIRALEVSSWNITRIGSKESLVSIKRVSCKELNKSDIRKGIVKTRFYFPSRAGKVQNGLYYTEMLWRRGWGRHDPPIFDEYVVPGTKSPIQNDEVTVETESYIELWDGIVLIFPPSS